MNAPKVFISYSHDSMGHRERVLALAERLRADGIEARLDQYVKGAPEEGWPRWMLNQMDWADYVLVICTETYYRRFRGHEVPGKGKGADWEGQLITLEMYHAKSLTTKFVPVLVDPGDEQFIPEPLRAYTHYDYDTSTGPGYAGLRDLLTGQAGVRPGDMGAIKRKPSEPRRQPDSFLRQLFRWWLDRKAERRYLRQVIEEHKYFTFLGRDTPFNLDRIYIALMVGKYVPPQERPDDPSTAPGAQRTGTVEVIEALKREPPRLLVLGEPGCGKTTLLKYLALRIASRDPAFGEFARKWVSNPWAVLADRLQRRLSSSHPWLSLFAGVFLLVALLLGALLLMLVDPSRSANAVWPVPRVTVLVWLGRVQWLRPWAIGAVALALVVYLYPFWNRSPLVALRWLRDRWTRFPLPVYTTLNDLAGNAEDLMERLACPLEPAGISDPPAFLRSKLKVGEALLLLDALDEVVVEPARERVAAEIVRAGAGARVPMLITCRIAAFAGHPLEYRFPSFWQMEVQEFSDRQVELFLQNWFADQPPEQQAAQVGGLLNALGRSSRMHALAANPLLLSLMALVYERNWRLPERRVELYEKCSDVLLEEWDKAKGVASAKPWGRPEKRAVLQFAAARFHYAGVRQFSRESLEEAVQAARPNAQADERAALLQEVLERSGLIRAKSRTSYDFVHLTFQEYFTALSIHERGGTASLIMASLGDPWWREVILLCVGLQADATTLLEELNRLDVFLAASALADARPVGTEAFTSAANRILAGITRLVETDASRRLEAAEALAELRQEEARAWLVKHAKEDQRPEIALASTLSLGRVAHRAALDELWPQVGPVLRRLHWGLGRLGKDWNQRILALLERLDFPLVFVPAGEFVIGNDKGAMNERPKHTVVLPNYWIGKYPVTNAQFARFVEETGYKVTEWRSQFGPGKARHPAVWVNWHDALAFCKWAGMGLPSEAEWEKAARGTDGRTYPWGNQWEAGRCNCVCLRTSPVDEYPQGVSPYGCFDMAGNVREWTRSLYRPYPYDLHDGREVPDGQDGTIFATHTHRVLRGGYWGNRGSHGLSLWSRYSSPPGSREDGFGFRLVCLKELT